MGLNIPLEMARTVFWTALRLGLTSFGGPVAHLGYFERTYVRQKGWLQPAEYAGLVALCQVLPGPASSQVGFLVGWCQAGPWGGLLSWLGFTLPSALLMLAFALFMPAKPTAWMVPLVSGLMLSAVPVVALAIVDLAPRLCPTWRHRLLALLAGVGCLVLAGGWAHPLVLFGGGLAGMWLLRERPAARLALPAVGYGWAVGAALALVLLYALLVLAADGSGFWALAEAHYRSALLVFGGGHVVLPLLRDALIPLQSITDDQFLAGYGLAQVVPGPLFSLAAYIGAEAAPAGHELGWSAGMLLAFFTPALLVALAGAVLWQRLTALAGSGPALGGVNAAVVGLLGAALYRPVGTVALTETWQVACAVLVFALLKWGRWPAAAGVGLCVAAAFAAQGWTRLGREPPAVGPLSAVSVPDPEKYPQKPLAA